MAEVLGALDPSEVVLPIIALIGLVPIVVQYRSQSKWFVVGYLLLVVATLTTNVENLLLEGVFNVAEHGLGLMGSAIAFLVAGYLRRQAVLGADDRPAGAVEAEG